MILAIDDASCSGHWLRKDFTHVGRPSFEEALTGAKIRSTTFLAEGYTEYVF
jgi:hypothetical protein